MKNKLFAILACVSFLSPLSAYTDGDFCYDHLSRNCPPSSKIIPGSCTWVNDYFTSVPNFPIPGSTFICFPNLLQKPQAFQQVIQIFADRYRETNLDVIVGLEDGGFILGAPLAYELGIPFVTIRQAGKLPRATDSINYVFNNETHTLEIERESINLNDRVLIIDDILATGSTAEAACQLVRKSGGDIIEAAFLADIPSLNGKSQLSTTVFTLTTVE
jgi:adenine phosphoribosyltransferase